MKKLVVFLSITAMSYAVCAMADNRTPIYGVPTLYGEYEITTDDVRRAYKMYGDAPVNIANPAPIRAAKNTGQSAAKHPVKVKAVIAKKKKTKKNKTAPKIIKSEPHSSAPDVIILTTVIDNQPAERVANLEPHVVVPAVKHVPKIPAIPGKYASSIAGAASYRFDVESYCTQRKHLYKGPLPDGIVLMPGRPDLMCCVAR